MPALPARALVVTPSPERAATLARGFDDVLSATPEQVPSLLVTRGHDLPCVVVSGVPGRGGRLERVIESLLTTCPPDVQFMLEVDAAVAAELRDGATGALRGLVLIDRRSLGGLPFLRFRPGENAGELPDLAAVTDLLGDELNLSALLPADAGLRSMGEIDTLTVRVADLERDLAAVTQALAGTSADLAAVRAQRDAAKEALERARARPQGLAAVAAMARRRGASPLALGVGAGVVVFAALAVAVAVSAQGGFQSGALTALLGLGALQVVLAWWGDRKIQFLVHQAKAATARADKGSADLARLDQRFEGAIANLAVAVARLERSVAVISASSVDTAESLAKLHDHLRGQAPLTRG